MIEYELVNCPLCYRETKDYMLYQIYKNNNCKVKVCAYCNGQYRRGATFNKKIRKWENGRKPDGSNWESPYK